MGDTTARETGDDVPFTDVYVDEAIVDRVNDILWSTRYVKGDQLATFEDGFAELCGTEHAVGVSSGTAAILLALKSADIEPGEEVFVPAHTFFATVSPVLEIGATPVLVDIDPEYYTLDPDALERAVERATDPAAVIPVHLYGQPADMERIQSIAAENGMVIVEDACQSHAASYSGERTGSLGDVGCFSFYPSKNMTVGGDGGMLVTDDDKIAHEARMRRNHGRDDDGVHRVLGLNHRLDEINAVVGLEQLKHVVEWGKERSRVADMYHESLAGIPELTLPKERTDSTHVYHLYVVRTEDRDELRAYLDERGIETGIHYPEPLHHQPPIEERIESDEVRTGDLKHADTIPRQILSLPMSPRFGQEEVHRVTDVIRDFYGVSQR